MARILSFFALMVLAQLGTGAYAQSTSLALCTASETGNYYWAGKHIRQAADSARLDVVVVATRGSMDNLERLYRRQCDAAIVQIDAYLVFQERHASNRLELERPLFLYDEYVHLVCNRDAKLERIQDLLDEATNHTVLVGNPASGSASTWNSFGFLEPGYTRVRSREVGGNAALESILNGDATCMMMVTGLRSPFTRQVENERDRLQIIDVNDAAFRKAKFAGDRIYNRRQIPASTYPSLQDGEDVQSVSVSAMLIVRAEWAEMNSAAHDSFVRAAGAAQPAISKRVSN